jgi:4-amino-4-deoxy-L-arabinose transferase-like glycosyltransferase
VSRNISYPSLLVLVSLLIFFPGLGARDLWAPVEPRYAEIVRVMLAKGEWIVPTVNGELYTDKPIFYFWVALVASMIAGGVTEWTLRFPSAASAVGLVVVTYALGRNFYSPRVGFMAALTLATTARVFWEGRWAHTDIPLTFFFTLSLYCSARALLKQGGARHFLYSYILIGFATLTKGLIGVALPGLILFCFAAVRKEWRALSTWRLPTGALVFAAVVAPWVALVSLSTDGRWLDDFVMIQHVGRFFGRTGHVEPFYYYFVNLPLDFLPWTIFVPGALWAARKNLAAVKEPSTLFLFLWFAVVFVFFSLSHTKRALYLLPLFPPAALFIACYFEGLIMKADPSSVDRVSPLAGFLVLAAASAALPFFVGLLAPDAVFISIPFTLILIVGAVAAMIALWRWRPPAIFGFTSAMFIVGSLYLAWAIFPFLDRYKSPRSFSTMINELVAPADPLYIYKDTMNDFNFYSGREVIPVLSSPDDWAAATARAGTVYVLVRDRDMSELDLERAVAVGNARVGGKKWRILASRGEKH